MTSHRFAAKLGGEAANSMTDTILQWGAELLIEAVSRRFKE
ncbi:MAG: hypothetical protein SH850_19530 [Planctomycetaceae bacterium]|nr:hypothetical protein [Planctomycetaceae bacterium]